MKNKMFKEEFKWTLPNKGIKIFSFTPESQKEFSSETNCIDTKKVATEVLDWSIKNVESYIDNKETVFLIYFTYDILEEEGLLELKKLQDLYYGIPNAEGENDNDDTRAMLLSMLDSVDAVVEAVKIAMEENSEKMAELFKRIIYYYEMIGFNRVTGPIVAKYDGHIQINHFFYEPVSMPVTVTKRMKKMDEEGGLIDTDLPPEIIKEFVVPEGFSFEVELVKKMVT